MVSSVSGERVVDPASRLWCDHFPICGGRGLMVVLADVPIVNASTIDN